MTKNSGKDNITQLLDSDESKLSITLRFELGRSIDKHVDSQQRSTLSSDDSRVLWKQMASALAFLHENSVTHDDVKPDNIMWDGEHRHAVLIDFGAALDYAEQPMKPFNASGTPPYVPPEFLQRHKCDAGDVWALGIVMLFALGHITLPDGNWLLPAVFEDGAARQELLAWLEMLENLRKSLSGGEILLAQMLDANPTTRISSSELTRQLGQ